LDDVRAFNYINKSPAHVYAAREVQKMIKLEFSYAFKKEPYPGVPEIILHLLKNEPFYLNGLKILPIHALHFNKNKFVYGFRIHDFTYITDAVKISEKEKRKIRGSKIFVINALRKKKHYSHFNLEEALDLMQEIKPERGFITHISHQMGCYRDINPELPEFVQLAYDGLKITF
jgi:phosphoribosyl 1,2-cyclic phosphate phosphodiesterase